MCFHTTLSVNVERVSWVVKMRGFWPLLFVVRFTPVCVVDQLLTALAGARRDSAPARPPSTTHQPASEERLAGPGR